MCPSSRRGCSFNETGFIYLLNLLGRDGALGAAIEQAVNVGKTEWHWSCSVTHMQPYITCLYCLLLSVNLVVFFLLCEMEGMHALSSGEMYPKLGYELKKNIYILGHYAIIILITIIIFIIFRSGKLSSRCITLAFVTGKMVAAQLSCIISWLVWKIMVMDVDGGEKKRKAHWNVQNFLSIILNV